MSVTCMYRTQQRLRPHASIAHRKWSVTTEKANALIPTEDDNGSHQSKSVTALLSFFFKTLHTILGGRLLLYSLCPHFAILGAVRSSVLM